MGDAKRQGAKPRPGHLVVATVLVLIGLVVVAWVDPHFGQLGWGPGDDLRAQLRGQGGVDCPCELASIQLLPGEGVAAGPLVLASGLLGFAAHARERTWRTGFATLGATSLFGALLVAHLVAMPAFDPEPWTSETPPPGQPAVLFFHAQWAPSTSLLQVEMTETVAVRRARQGFAIYEADMTRADEAATQAVFERWGIKGLPTTVFLDPGGNELSEYRLNHFESREAFARRLRCVKAVIDAREGVASLEP